MPNMIIGNSQGPERLTAELGGKVISKAEFQVFGDDKLGILLIAFTDGSTLRIQATGSVNAELLS